MTQHYCIFKGTDSRDLGLYMEKCPERISPKRREESIVISGRHGTLTATDGTFETYIRSTEFIVKNKSRIDEICALFKGSGWLIFSDAPCRRFKARVNNQIEFSHIIRHLKRFIVEFEVQPFGYEISPQTIVKTAPFSLFNIGTFESEPIITVYGQGNITLTVNNSNVILKGINEKITLNTELLNAYNGALSLNNKMLGDFPVLSLGNNNISWTGNVTKLEITPNWRWL